MAEQFRLTVTEPFKDICLLHETSDSYDPLRQIYSKPMDVGFLYQLKRVNPGAAYIIIKIETRTDYGEWTEITSRVEFLP